MTVKCGKCGEESRDNAKFCKSCGTKLRVSVNSVACPACGKPAQPDDTFCGECGARISADDKTETEVEKYDGPWRLTDVVREWIKLQEWDDEPELDDVEGTSSTKFHFETDDNQYIAYFDVNEKYEIFRVYIYAIKLKIPAMRIEEANELARLISLSNSLGHVQILVGDDEDATVRYYHAIGIENASFEPGHVQNMFRLGGISMDLYAPQFASICEGKSAEEVYSED